MFLITQKMSAVLLVLCGAAWAGDKSEYNLFKRTPKEQLRDLSTDRPDLTESPSTVDAGWFQLEMDIASYLEDSSTVERFRAVGIGALNLKAGVLNNVDIQFIWTAYMREETVDRATGVETTVSGSGDLVVRVKWNLWGNDGGETALAVMPFLKIPTAKADVGNREVEGGIIVPFGMDIGGGWGLGLQAELDFFRTDDNTRDQLVFAFTVVVGRDLTEDLGFFVEVFAAFPTEDSTVVTFDFGFTYSLGPNVQLDVAVVVGVTDAAPDVIVFVGISLRF